MNQQDREQKFRKINFYALIFYYLVCVGYIIYKFAVHDYTNMLQTLIGPFMPLIPVLVFRIFRLTLTEDFKFVYLVFVFFAAVIGVEMRGYSWIPYFDKVTHFCSGIFLSVFGVGVYYCLKPEKKIDPVQDIKPLLGFDICFTMATALLWEFYEYAVDNLLGFDSQNVLTTGVHDTMQDTIAATLAGIIMAVFIYRHIRLQKPCFIMKIFDHFFEVNFLKSKPE